MKYISHFLAVILVAQSLFMFWMFSNTCETDFYNNNYDNNNYNYNYNNNNNNNNNNNSNYVSTVVTAYFPLKSAKHSKNEYKQWMETFFQIEGPVVIYTTTEMVDQIKKMRNNNGPIRFITEYETPFDIEVNIVLKDTYSGKQYDLDPEKYHNGFLYAVWNGKSAMLARATRENFFNTNYFFWVDVGSFRVPGPPFRDWPNNERVISIWQHASKLLQKQSSEILLMSNILPFANQLGGQFSWGSLAKSPLKVDSMIGTFFGGPAPAVLWWYKSYYSALNHYFAKGFFIGKDQHIMNAVAAQNEDRIVSLDASQTQCGNGWFFFQTFLSKESEWKKEFPNYNCEDKNFLKKMRDI